MLRTVTVTMTLATALTAAALAQSRTQGFGRASAAWCNDGGNGDRASFCEVREETVSGVNPLDVDAGRNGGIRVRGWDRGDVLVRARIVGYADTDAEARRIVSGVRLTTTGGSVRAEGPDGGARRPLVGQLRDPGAAHGAADAQHQQRRDLDRRTSTAPRSFAPTTAASRSTTSPATSAARRPTAACTIDLAGDRWDGAGLDVETRNGGIRMSCPNTTRPRSKRGRPTGASTSIFRSRCRESFRNAAQHHARRRRREDPGDHDQRRRDDSTEALKGLSLNSAQRYRPEGPTIALIGLDGS